MDKNKKNNIISVFFTFLVIGMLILSGPVSAIDVNLTTEDIDFINEDTKVFTIEVDINDGEFLPLSYTNLIFDDSLTCKINNDNTIDNCDFLTVERTMKNLNGEYGYGYGYGYGYDAPNYGYGYDFGYGYGYSGETGYGTITYTITVDVSEIPVDFLNNNINVEARVYGGTEDNYRYFKGTSSFFVHSSYVSKNLKRFEANTINSGDVTIQYEMGTLPNDVSQITVTQVAPLANPVNTNFEILGKVYDFTTDGSTDFDKDLTITFTYTDEELGDYDESRIYPAFYNTLTEDWEQLTVVSRMPNDNKLTFLTNHFTQFTLLADTSTPIVDNTPTGGGRRKDKEDDTTPIRRSVGIITPEEIEEVPEIVVTPEEETGPTGFSAITGAVIGVLGAGGSIVVLILAIGGLGFGSYSLVKRKGKKGKRKKIAF